MSQTMAVELGPLVVHMTVRGAAAAIDFYRRVFGADELYRNTEGEGGRIVHAELLVRGARVVVHDEFPEWGMLGPVTTGGASVSLNLYVDDARSLHAAALAAGAAEVSAPTPHFWGAVSGAFIDPFGHQWIVSTQVEDLSPDEIVRRSRGAPTYARLSAARPPVEG
jgi:PhnB protein